MRSTISKLLSENKVRIVEREVDPKFELAAVVATSQKESDAPILFNNIKGSDFPVICNLYGSNDRLREMIAVKEGGFCQNWARTIKDAMYLDESYINVPEPEQRQNGSLNDLPWITWREKDTGPYITSGVVMVKDPETGIANLSFSRGQIISGDEVRCCFDAVQDLAKYQAKAEAKNEALEIAWLIGAPPSVFLSACTTIGIDEDELKIAAQVSGGTIDMRECEEIDLLVPLETEIVVEARIRPHERRSEAPFGEFMGFYCEENQGYVADIVNVSWRENAYYHGLLCGSREDLTAVHACYATRAYQELTDSIPGVIDVSCNTTLHCTVVKINKQFEGHAQQVFLKVFATNPHYNYACMVVDEDVDIYDLNDVWWAYLNRGGIQERTMILSDIPAGYDYSQPTLQNGRIGIDATAPYGQLHKFERCNTPGESTIKMDEYLAKPLV